MPEADVNDLPRSPFDEAYGLRIVQVGSERGEAQVPVSSRVKGPAGEVLSGIYSAAAEALASTCTVASVDRPDVAVMGMRISTTVLAPCTTGTFRALAGLRARQSGQLIWNVDVVDDDGTPCATSVVTVAVRERPAR